MKVFCTFCLLFFWRLSTAQETDTIQTSLETVTIKAFEQRRQLKDVPAAVSFINRQGLERFGPGAIVHAVNTLPGVRMEERSPGSYRFNIRGSSLRSPFGVRNVKVYYNDIPFTDPGGNTYLNGLGYYNFNSIEIVKGPGSSLYGAGTGGVLLIESLNANEQNNVFGEYAIGSFGLRNAFASVTTGAEESKNKIGFQHQQSEGYRYHSALERDIFSWSGRFGNSEKSFLKTTFLYSDLFYETPGALTKAEFETNPRLSRPGGFGFPSAEAARASIQQKTFLGGLSYTHHFNSQLTNTSTAYGMFTELRNPTIRNYGKGNEPHVGGRTSFTYRTGSLGLMAGGELQQGFTSVSIHQNKEGNPDVLQSLDDISIRQSFVFLQATFEKWGWELTGSSSLNFLQIEYKRTAPAPLPVQTRNFDNEFAPRVSLARKWNDVTVYTSVARGFSPPTSAELLPSGSAINFSLNPEQGTNYELGTRGRFKNFTFDVNAFLFSLENTIVQRRDAGGGEFFINAGKTKQRGVETSITYPLLNGFTFTRQSQFWVSHTWHRFKYDEFKQLTNDFSGNRLPGVAPHTISTGLDLQARNGLLANVSYFFSDRIPLNDANTDYANAFHLLHAKIGFEKWFSKNWRSKLVFGAENLLDVNYSLGNDINGFGGRYFNAAPGRSFYASLIVQVMTGKNQ